VPYAIHQFEGTEQKFMKYCDEKSQNCFHTSNLEDTFQTRCCFQRGVALLRILKRGFENEVMNSISQNILINPL
jgi:hypothetical protein